MIAFIDRPPTIEPHGGGFLLTFNSGDTETAFMVTLHALSGLVGKGMARVKEAQVKAAGFVPTPFQVGEWARESDEQSEAVAPTA